MMKSLLEILERESNLNTINYKMKKILFAVAILVGVSLASCNNSCSTSQCENQNDSTMVMDSDSLVVDSLEITE